MMQTGSQGNKEQQGAAACDEHVRIVLKIELVDRLVHIGCNCKLEGSLFYIEVEDRDEVAIVSAAWSLPAACAQWMIS